MFSHSPGFGMSVQTERKINLGFAAAFVLLLLTAGIALYSIAATGSFLTISAIVVLSGLAMILGAVSRRFLLRDLQERSRILGELQQARARFEGILSTAEDAIITVNLSQRIIFFNQGAEKTFGYSAKEVIGKPLEILLPKRFAESHYQHVVNFSKGLSSARRMGERSEIYGLRKDGTEFPAEASISRLQTEDGMIFTAAVRDISERKRAEAAILKLNRELEQRVRDRTAELEESNRQLQQKSEENETFVYGVSHDLRSPLVNLEGFSKELGYVSNELSKLLENPDVPGPIRDRGRKLLQTDMADSVRYIQSAVARLSNIIDALLRLSRAGRVVYRMERIDTEALVRRILESMRGTITKHGTEVTTGELPPIEGDAIAIEQVFANLIGNALNYLDPLRPGRIEIGSMPGDRPDYCCYFVRDNGLGISETHIGKVFQAFQRLHPDRVAGEGMGLTIVRRIVDRHGGRIWLESKMGEGTTFFVLLPAASHTKTSLPTTKT